MILSLVWLYSALIKGLFFVVDIKLLILGSKFISSYEIGYQFMAKETFIIMA